MICLENSKAKSPGLARHACQSLDLGDTESVIQDEIIYLSSYKTEGYESLLGKNEYKQIRNKQYVSKTNVFNNSFGGDGDDCCRTG